MADLDRRRFLQLGAASLVAGCAPNRPGSVTRNAARHGAGSSPSSRPTSRPSQAALPPVRRWHPDPNDLVPAAKIAAVHAVENLHNRQSVVHVIDAQYGGLLPGAASVLVVCRTWTRVGSEVHEGGPTYDVRVVLGGTHWRVTAVHPSHPGAAAGALAPQAREVLADRRIKLPPAARADVRSGLVHESVLSAMLTLAQTYRFGVSVLRSGHPTYVFGTSRLSDHPRGRAFDTWLVDGHAVVDARTPRRLVVAFMEAAAAAGSYNVGGPYALGSAPQFFSDRTHHDHVHAGFTT